MDSAAVRRRVPPQWLINLINPVVRGMARSPLHGLVDPALLVLHLTGRRTGRRMDIPVGYLLVDGDLLVTTQHTWRANLRGGADLDVTYRGRRRRVHADLVDEPVAVAAILHHAIDQLGWDVARRQLAVGTTDGHAPRPEELADAARQFDLAVVMLRFIP